MKVMTIIGTRPEIIRLSRIMAALDRYTKHLIVHTGQNYDYELNEIFFQELEIRKPDYFLDAAGATPAETVGLVIAKSDELMRKEKPDAILILGDTNSSLSAYSAKRLKIPIFHMEAGNRCFDQRVPEEVNRRIVDHMSDINMPYSSISREYLMREGMSPDRVIKTGSPMYEVLHYYLPKIEISDVLQRLNLPIHEYILVSSHREENIDSKEKFQNLVKLLNGLAEYKQCRIIVSTHPRTRKKLKENTTPINPLVELHKPFGYFDYVKLQKNALVVVSDSGTVTEESSILNFPAIHIRDAHERPEGMEEGAVMLTGMNVECVLDALNVLQGQRRDSDRNLNIVSSYNIPNLSEKIVRIIISYTHYVNQYVWHKPAKD